MSTPASSLEARQPLDFSRSPTSWRNLKEWFWTGLMIFLAVLAMVPLFSVLYEVITKGAKPLTINFWETLSGVPPLPLDPPGVGGIRPAIVGTFKMVGIASLISVPLGIITAIYLAEFGATGKFAGFVRFSIKILTGLPSIIAMVFIYATVVLTTGTFSAYAGGMALAILMIPIVTLTAEEALKTVPQKMKEAAFGLGANHSQVVWKIVLPTALPNILTGVMLAIARAAGETAPLLFTALFAEDYSRTLSEETCSLSVLIYQYSQRPQGGIYQRQYEFAWTGALVLMTLVLVLNLSAQALSRRKYKA